MSAPADIDLAAIVRAALEEGPAPLALPLPLESFIGLTLLPAWTDELAAHVVGRLSPDAPWTPRQSVARMQTDGLVVTVGTLGEVRYAISPSTETDVTRQARLRHVERSLLSILGVVRGVVASASEADRRDLAVWCDVVDLLLADPGGLLLVERVDALGVGDGSAPDPSAPPAVSAASVLGAAEHLGDVIGGGVVDAVRRARWRLDWRLRQAVDLGILRDYHRRRAIEERLAHLVGRGDSARAVHLLGTGGVGKTMTLRYLGSPRFAEDHAVPAPAIGRVDFDHLDPSFPERRPLLLLEALATDLLGQLSGREASYHLRTFQDAATLSFEATVEEEEPTDVDDPRVVAGVDAFAQLVSAAFGADRRVLLVLDTCEELARLAAAGSMAPAVQATFRLLDRVLRSADNVRVVFAGRRPLVPDGHPSPAPFELEVVRIGGFDRDEALGYVSRHAPQLTGEQQEGLLRVAEAPDADGIVRYNPFELAAWTAWLRQEPTLDLDDLRTSGDPYVEHRIIGRAREPFVLAMLPVIAWLERFDRSMIAPALVRAGLDADATFDVLAAQEWLSVEAREDDGRPGTLELLGGLGGRMRRYFERHPDRFSVDHERLAADLEQLLAAGRLDLRGRDDALVALARVMPRRLARDVWADVERHVTEQKVWSWARQVLPRVAGDVRDRDEGQPSVLAAILATRAAALARAGPSGVAEAWRDVAREVHRIPDEDWRELLADRATCGEVAFMTSPDPLRLERVMHDRLPIGSLAAAMWSVADAARAAGFLGELPRWTRDRLSAAEDPVARAYAALIANAADPIFGDDGGELWRVADELGEAADPVAWTDCPVPEGLAHRCRLAALLRDRLPPRSVQVDRAGVRDIDGERLASALLEYTLDNGLPSSADLDVCVADERAAWDIGRASTY